MFRALTTLSGPLAQTGTVAQWGAVSLIKSVQSGYLTGSSEGSYTATITEVVPENCILLHQGFNQSGNVQPIYFAGSIVLTNATTVSFVRYTAGGSAMGIAWTVVEFLPGVIKSVQAGSTALSASTTGTSTINQVTPEKCALFYEGFTSTDSTGNSGLFAHRVALTNATTITGTTNNASTGSVSWRLVEFY